MREAPAIDPVPAGISPALQLLLLWIVGSVLMVAFSLMGLSAAFADGQYVPSHGDAFYHARRILDAVMTGQPVMQFDRHMHLPEGSWVTWPWSFDAAMAAITRCFGPFRDAAAANAVLMHIPVFAGPVAVALVVWLSQLLRLRFALSLALVVAFVCLPSVHASYSVGNVDHHFAESLWTSAAICAGIWFWRNPHRLAPACLLGAILGSACGVHMSLFILQLPLVALYLLRWLRAEALPPGRVTSALAAALLLVTLAICLPSGPFRAGLFDFYTLSGFHLYVAAGSAVFMLLPTWLPRRAPQVAMLFVAAAAALVPLVGALDLGTRFLAGNVESTRGIQEIYSPYVILFDFSDRYSAPFLLNALWLALPAMFYCLHLLIRKKEAELQYFALAAAMGLLLLQLQARLHVFGELALLAVPLFALRTALDTWPRHAAKIALSACALFALVLLPIKDHWGLQWRLAHSPGYAEIRGVFPILRAACERRPGVVLADTEAGHWVRYHTDCSVIGNVFLLTPQQEAKAQQTDRLLSRAPRELLSAEPAISYVLVFHTVSIDPRREPDLEAFRQRLPALEAALLGRDAALPPDFTLLWKLDTPAGQPYARLFEIARHPPL
jgi:hypothetical protein